MSYKKPKTLYLVILALFTTIALADNVFEQDPTLTFNVKNNNQPQELSIVSLQTSLHSSTLTNENNHEKANNHTQPYCD